MGKSLLSFVLKRIWGLAVDIAERIRDTIMTKEWGFDKQFNLTCSFGVAELADESCDDLIKRADLALLKAKKMGRNRIEISWDRQQYK